MRILLFLILFVIILIFAPGIFVDLFMGAVLIGTSVFDSTLGLFILGLLGVFIIWIIASVIKAQMQYLKSKKEGE